MINKTITRLKEEDFLNEERFAKAFARGKFRINKWGKKMIIFELRKRGISETVIDSGLSEISDEDYQKTLKELIRKKKEELKGEKHYIKQICQKEIEISSILKTTKLTYSRILVMGK